MPSAALLIHFLRRWRQLPFRPCRARTPISEDAELRLFTEADAKELHELIEANRAHLAAWLPWAAEQDYADTLGFIRETRAQLQANDGFQVAVCVHERVAGVIGFTAVDWESARPTSGDCRPRFGRPSCESLPALGQDYQRSTLPLLLVRADHPS